MSEETIIYYIADALGEKVDESTSLKEAVELCPAGGQVYINLSAYARKIFYFA